jgi:hypothetical protein
MLIRPYLSEQFKRVKKSILLNQSNRALHYFIDFNLFQ